MDIIDYMFDRWCWGFVVLFVYTFLGDSRLFRNKGIAPLYMFYFLSGFIYESI